MRDFFALFDRHDLADVIVLVICVGGLIVGLAVSQ